MTFFIFFVASPHLVFVWGEKKKFFLKTWLHECRHTQGCAPLLPFLKQQTVDEQGGDTKTKKKQKKVCQMNRSLLCFCHLNLQIVK